MPLPPPTVYAQYAAHVTTALPRHSAVYLPAGDTVYYLLPGYYVTVYLLVHLTVVALKVCLFPTVYVCCYRC